MPDVPFGLGDRLVLRWHLGLHASDPLDASVILLCLDVRAIMADAHDRIALGLVADDD